MDSILQEQRKGRHMGAKPVKIAIIGPESTGKTTLAEKLGRVMEDVIVIPEMAREWLAENREDQYPHPEDYETFLRLQYEATIGAEKLKPRYIISDTEAITTKIWARRLHQIELDITSYLIDFDAYLLLSPQGVPFTPDAQRYGGEMRQLAMHTFFANLVLSGIYHYMFIFGDWSVRVSQASSLLIILHKAKH